jgi:hypothetical protein
MAYKKRNQFEFKSIIEETNKARHFIMSGGNQMWLPKKSCPVTDNMVTIPKWLQNAIMESGAKKMEREMKQLKLELV